MKYARFIFTVIVIGLVGCESSEVNNPAVTKADSSATEISEAFEFTNPTFEGRASLAPQDMRIVPLDVGRIAVEIRRADGSLDTDAAGRLLPRGDDYGIRIADNDDGLLTFTNLAPGPYTLLVAFGRGNNQSARQKNPHRLNFSRERAREAIVRRMPDLVVDVNVTAGENDLVEVRDPGEGAKGSVICIVRDADGNPLAGADVWLTHAVNGFWKYKQSVIANASGQAVFGGLPHGRYKLQTRRVITGDPQATVTLDGGEARVSLTAIPMFEISGVVVGPTGAPVADAKVRLSRVGSAGTNARTGAQGKFHFALYPAGYVMASIDCEGFVSVRKVLKNDGTPWRIELVAGRKLDVFGLAALPDGTKVRGRISYPSGSHGLNGRVLNGRFRISLDSLHPQAAGKVLLRVGETVPVELPYMAGQAELDFGALQLDPGESIRGRVRAPVGWLSRNNFRYVFVGETGLSLNNAEIEADGTFEVKGLPREPFELWLTVVESSLSSVGAKLRVDPVAQTDLGEIELTPEKREPWPEIPNDYDCKKITITDPTGTLGTTGFTDGDLIVGIEGDRFENPIQMQEVFEKHFGEPPINRGTLTFNVLRGGEEVRVQVTDYYTLLVFGHGAGGRILDHKR